MTLERLPLPPRAGQFLEILHDSTSGTFFIQGPASFWTGLSHSGHCSELQPPQSQTADSNTGLGACWNYSDWTTLNRLTLLRPFLNVETMIKAPVHVSPWLPLPTRPPRPTLVLPAVALHGVASPSPREWRVTNSLPNSGHLLTSWSVGLTTPG